MFVVRRTVAVYLVQDPLHGRGGHAMHDVDERSWLERPDLLNDSFGHPVEVLEPVIKQRIDRDLAEHVPLRAVGAMQFGPALVWVDDRGFRIELGRIEL